jgi:hypothetical protein
VPWFHHLGMMNPSIHSKQTVSHTASTSFLYSKQTATWLQHPYLLQQIIPAALSAGQ